MRTLRREDTLPWDFLPYGHFAVSYVKLLIIGKHNDTAQKYGTSIGFPIIITIFTHCTFEYNILNLYKLDFFVFSIRLFLVCAYNFVWLYKFFIWSRFEKENKILKNLSPWKCVLQSTLRYKVRMEKECFCEKQIWSGDCQKLIDVLQLATCNDWLWKVG